MSNTVHYGLCLALILCTLRPAQAVGYPIDVINSQQYQGNYIATQPTVRTPPRSPPSTTSTASKAA